MYKHFFKRLLDIILAVLGLVVILPLFLIVTSLLLFANNGKPFYFQKRPGKDARIFKLFKFKTMNDKRDENGQLLPPASRITGIGRFLRASSLDEIPQLWNVLKGDMSLIGPRPLLVEYLSHYSDFQKRRHEVRPGITGWAQVNGRNAISWTKKFEYDVWYVDNVSFLLDLKILWLTVVKVIKKEGVNASAEVTMEPFNGKN